MKLVYNGINEHFEFSKNIVNRIVIENQSFMNEFIINLLGNFNNFDTKFVLSDELKILKFEKYCDYLIDYFNIDFNSKDITNYLYKEIQNVYFENNYDYELKQIENNLQGLLYKIFNYINLPISISQDLDFKGILKCYNTRLEFSFNDSLLEKLVNYINILIEIKHINILFLINLKSYLNDEDFKSLYNFCNKNEFNLFLIDNIVGSQLDNEKIVVIDKDLCEILAKSIN